MSPASCSDLAKPPRPRRLGGPASSGSMKPRLGDKSGDVSRLKGRSHLLPEMNLVQARQMGARMCSLLEKAPEAYQDHLRAQLVAGLFQRFRAHLRQALIMGNLLGAPASSTSSSAPGTKKPVEDDFAVARDQLGQADELCRSSAKVTARDYRWPLGARDLHALAPELRQLCTWGLSLGESSSASSSGSAPPTPEFPGRCVGPEDYLPRIDVDAELDSPTLDNDRRGRHRSPGSSAPARKKDKSAPADDADMDATTGRDETSLMQHLMDHSDPGDTEEHVHNDMVDGFNLEWRPSTSSMVAMLNSTLGHLWERGDEMMAQAIASRFCQLGAQMQHAHPCFRVLWELHVCAAGYARGMVPGYYLSPAWQDWTTAAIDLSLQLARGERHCMRESDTLRDNINDGRRGHNDNDLGPMVEPDDDAVAFVSRPGRTRKASRRPVRPQSRAAEMAPTASLTESWVGVEPGTTPVPAAPWRQPRDRSRSTPTTRGRPQPKARPHCRDAGTAAHSATARSSRDAVALTPPAERAAAPASTAPTCDAADALPEDLDNPDLPMVAARFWRPLLGLDGPADDPDDDGGLLPHQRRPVARRLLQATPTQRVQYLSFLNFFCATVIQEVSALP